MKLTAFTDYALRVLIYLATEPERHATIAEIAGAFDISENHLVKVVHFLSQKGWVATVRGKGGGLQLACSPETICIGAVVRETEGPPMPAECFSNSGGHCPITTVCQLKGVLAEAMSAFHAELDRYTLDAITRNRESLCELLADESQVRWTQPVPHP